MRNLVDGSDALTRRVLLAACAAAPAAAGAAAAGLAPIGSLNDFDFLQGSWHVRHHCLIQATWQNFDGACTMQKVLGGQANIDDNQWRTPAGSFSAMTVRVFDPTRRVWTIFWLDTRWPSAFGPPVIGGFDGARGAFFGDDQLNGRPIRVRFHWFSEHADLCHWEQAYSLDQGRTWETNWRMRFERAA